MDIDQIPRRHNEEEYETADFAMEYEDESRRQPETQCKYTPRPISLFRLGFCYVLR